jgi:hypothetical protein
VNWVRKDLENPRENTNLLKDALDYAQLELIHSDGPDDYRNIKIIGGDPLLVVWLLLPLPILLIIVLAIMLLKTVHT